MSVNQRAQYERAELGEPSTGVRVRSRGAVVAFTVVGLVLLAVLAVAAVELTDSWVQGLVLAVIALTAVGLMVAVNPRRRA